MLANIAAVAVAAAIEQAGRTTRIEDIAKTRRCDLYRRCGNCSNAGHGTFGDECGKPATWLGRTHGGFQSGRCDRCKEDGDERFGLVFERLPRKTILYPAGCLPNEAGCHSTLPNSALRCCLP